MVHKLGEILRDAVILLSSALIWTSADAHHSAIIFDQSQEIVIEGEVSGFDWQNPHVYVYVDVEDDTGQLVRWQLEGTATPTMARSGWGPTTLVEGERVTARGHPNRSATRQHAMLTLLSKPDGTRLGSDPEQRRPSVVAESIFGLWEKRPGGTIVDLAARTEKGAASQAAFDVADQPTSDCIPLALPQIVNLPYMYAISMQGEHILIRSEFYEVERIVYMDEREHPENGERTIQGHSIGWWDDEVLVVDTTLFADHRMGNAPLGVPSGAQKHVVEKYQLTEDHTQLAIDLVVRDPEYLLGPATARVFWEYAPDKEMAPFACDPENAQLWKFE